MSHPHCSCHDDGDDGGACYGDNDDDNGGIDGDGDNKNGYGDKTIPYSPW